MKIDLHCHTKKTKAGDFESRQVTPELFARKIRDASVDIVAITNHNVFDFEQFQLLQKAVTGECTLWPGIEFDVECKSRSAHMLVICNPLNVELFNDKVKAFTGNSSPDEFSATIEAIVSNFEYLDTIFIPHHYKEPELSESDIQELQSYLEDETRVFLESTYRSVGILANFKSRVVAGSDVQNWQDYDKYSLPELRLPIETFSQFCLLAKKDEQVISTLLNRKKPFQVKASPSDGVTIDLVLYPDINILFGQKGTGKSRILDSLIQLFISQGKTCGTYLGSKKDEDFSVFEKIDFSKVTCETLVHNDCEREINALLSWKESKITDLQDYIDSIETASAKKSRRELKITDTKFLDSIPNSTVSEDFSIAKNVHQKLTALLNKSYLEFDLSSQLEDLSEKLVVSIHERYKAEWIGQKAIYLSNNLIERFRFHADNCTGSKSRPLGTGFRQFAEARFNLGAAILPIWTSIKEVPEDSENEYLGNIEGKGTLYIRTRLRFLCNDSDAREFPNNITALRKVFKEIESVYKNYYSAIIGEKVSLLQQEFTQKGIKCLSSFVGIRKDYVLNETQPYTPSTGEKGIILIERVLNQDADVYVLDEPEMDCQQ